MKIKIECLKKKDKYPSFINKAYSLIFLIASLFNPSYASKEFDKEIRSNVEMFYSVFSDYWRSDKTLNKNRPPQIIILNRGSTVLGGCYGKDKKKNHVFSGSQYCAATNTILLDIEQLRDFYKVHKAPGLLFVTAHEAVHAVQQGKSYFLKEPFHELHADCLASRIMKVFEPNMTENELKFLSKLLINSGSETHGHGLDRTASIEMGLGLIKGNCRPLEIYEITSREKIH